MSEQRSEPYVGPQPFRRADAWRFFGREERTEELFSLLVASRTVVLYAQSGAGKTSIVNAGLCALAEREGFDILPPARVKGVLPEGMRLTDLPNRYVFFTLLSWRGSSTDIMVDPRDSLRDALRARPHPKDRYDAPVPRLVVFDQFEEVFTSYPEQWVKRQEFFEQIVAALEDDVELRVLFVLREDYLADLLAVADMMPDGMRSRARLARLGREEASAAIARPVESTHRSFAKGVVQQLVDELLMARVEVEPGAATEIVGDFVEPVQLQVVCSELWRSLPPEATVITAEHARRYGDVTAALTEYYKDAVAQTSASTGVWRRLLRDWFSYALITPASTRAMVYRGVHLTDGMPNPAVDMLENLHIVRAENRAGARWYELTHDRFIRPIQRSNQRQWEFERKRLLISLGAAVVAGVGALGILALTKHYPPPWSSYLCIFIAAAATTTISAVVRWIMRIPPKALVRARLVAKRGRRVRLALGVAGTLVLGVSLLFAGVAAVRSLLGDASAYGGFPLARTFHQAGRRRLSRASRAGSGLRRLTEARAIPDLMT